MVDEWGWWWGRRGPSLCQAALLSKQAELGRKEEVVGESLLCRHLQLTAPSWGLVTLTQVNGSGCPDGPSAAPGTCPMALSSPWCCPAPPWVCSSLLSVTRLAIRQDLCRRGQVLSWAKTWSWLCSRRRENPSLILIHSFICSLIDSLIAPTDIYWTPIMSWARG